MAMKPILYRERGASLALQADSCRAKPNSFHNLVKSRYFSGNLKPISGACHHRWHAGRDVQGNYSKVASEEQQSMSLYDLLGIPKNGSLAEIKQAYKQLARRYHPDVCPNPDQSEEYTRRFVQVQEAYEVLSDPPRRALYDQHLAMGFKHYSYSTFSARKRRQYYTQQDVGREDWKSRWESQLAGLKRRSAYKDAGRPLSWAARVRRENAQSSQPSEE
jgi:hypothetical protein